jgi:queuosine precursor transporter
MVDCCCTNEGLGDNLKMKLDKRIQLFLVLASVFVVALVVGDIVGGKLMEVRVFGMPFTISVGMIPFPITFVLTDILNEFYGERVARNVTWVGFAMAVFSFGVLTLAVALPWAPFTRSPGWAGMNERSFNNVFSGSQRILLASMAAYLVSQFSDIAVFHFLKRISRNKHLWLRATGSTVVSQLIDSVVVQAVAWYGMMPIRKIGAILVSSYAVKLVVAIGLTPLIYAGHVLVERLMGIEPVILDEHGEPVEHPPANPTASAIPAMVQPSSPR